MSDTRATDSLVARTQAMQRRKLAATREEQTRTGVDDTPRMSRISGISAQLMERIEARREEAKERREAEIAAFTGDCIECWDDPETVCMHCERGRALYERRQEAQAHQFVRDSGLAARFHDHTFATYPGTGSGNVETFCQGWDGERNMILVGRYGVGKTGLIAAAMRRVAPRYLGGKQPMHFTSTVALTDALRAGYSDGSFQATLDRAKTCRLLILDDLGSEKATEWVHERLFSIIDERYGNHLPTWATSNLPPDSIAPQIGERTWWRLLEHGDVIVVEGPNLRERRTR